MQLAGMESKVKIYSSIKQNIKGPIALSVMKYIIVRDRCEPLTAVLS